MRPDQSGYRRWKKRSSSGRSSSSRRRVRCGERAAPESGAQSGGAAVPSSYDAATYLRTLQGLGCQVDAWETTYLHVLHGEDPVFTWVSGTGARPTLQALPDDLRPDFEAEFKRRLREAYPDDGSRPPRPRRTGNCSGQSTAFADFRASRLWRGGA